MIKKKKKHEKTEQMALVKPQQLIALGLKGWERAKHETDTDV